MGRVKHEREVDIQTDSQTDRKADRQTETEIEKASRVRKINRWKEKQIKGKIK